MHITIAIMLAAVKLSSQGTGDALDDAIFKLATDSNMPPPAGTSISWAQPGALPANLPGFAESEDPGIPAGNTAIVVNPLVVAEFWSRGASAQETCDVVAAVLFHEYQHTPEYGEPSTDGEPGWGNGICAHIDVFISTQDFICQLIDTRKSEGLSVYYLCRLADRYVGVINSNLPARNSACGPPPLDTLYLCNGCGE